MTGTQVHILELIVALAETGALRLRLLVRTERIDGKTLELLRDRMGLQVIGVDASERFLARLKGVVEPEEKRKRIGAEFIAVFDEQGRQLARMNLQAR